MNCNVCFLTEKNYKEQKFKICFQSEKILIKTNFRFVQQKTLIKISPQYQNYIYIELYTSIYCYF